MNTITVRIPLADDSIHREEYTVKLTGESVSPESIMFSLETACMISGFDITSNHAMFYPLPFEVFERFVQAGIKPRKVEEFDYEQLSFPVSKKNTTKEQLTALGFAEDENMCGYGLFDFFMQFIGYSVTDFSYEVLEIQRYKFNKGKYVEVSSSKQ